MSGSTVEQSTVNRSRKGATRMREDTIGRKKASVLFQELRGRRWLLGRMAEVISEGKRGLDGLALELGRMVAEAVMYLEREEVAGPDYRPYSSEVRKWASQGGSVFIGDRKALSANISETLTR